MTKTKIYIIFVVTGLMLMLNNASAGDPHGIWGYCFGFDNMSSVNTTVAMYISNRPEEVLYGKVGANQAYLIDTGNFPTPWKIGEHLIIKFEKADCVAGAEIILNDAGAQRVNDVVLSCPLMQTSPDTTQNITRPLINQQQEISRYVFFGIVAVVFVSLFLIVFKRKTRKVGAVEDKKDKKYTLNEHEINIINELLKENNITQMELMRRTGIAKSTISYTLTKLENKGMIHRVDDGVSKKVNLEEWVRIRESKNSLNDYESLIVEELRKENDLTQTELCARCNIPKATISRTLDSLENKGIIKRTAFGMSKKVRLEDWMI